MTTTAVAVSSVLRIPLDLIDPGPNVRGQDVGDVSELVETMKVVGQLTPVLVVPAEGDRWRLKDGHRRHKAAPLAGRDYLDAVVHSNDPDLARRAIQQLAIQGNTKPFGPMAEARALYELRFEHNWSREQIARAIGKSPGFVRDRISLVHLTPEEQRAVEAGRLTVGEALFRLKTRRATRDGGHPPASTPPPARPRAKTRVPQRRQVCPTCRQPIKG